jgi:hypothetical protein
MHIVRIATSNVPSPWSGETWKIRSMKSMGRLLCLRKTVRDD